MGNTADAAGVAMCISHAFKKVFFGERHPVLLQRRASYNGLREPFEETDTKISSCQLCTCYFPVK